MSDNENLPAASAVETELAEIEDRIADDGDFQDESAQGRDRQLTEATQNGVTFTDPEAQAVAFWESAPGQAVYADWSKHGNPEQSAKDMVVLAKDFMDTVPDRQNFEAQVNLLSFNTQIQMGAELVQCYISRDIPLASRDDIEQFSESLEAEALVAEWGTQAPRKVAVVGRRLARVFSRLTEAEAKAARDFLENISGPAFTAILRYLARAA